MREQNVAIAGATGAVGAEFIKLLEKRNYPVKNIKLLASKRSVGAKLKFKGKTLAVEELTKKSFKGVDTAFFSAGATRSLEFAPYAADSGALVIDNSSAFRMDKNIPLVVPEVNPKAAKKHQGIIANPNCSTIQMVVALGPFHKTVGLKSIIVSTYQAVSGSGVAALGELEAQNKAIIDGSPIISNVYPVQIANNLIPHIDVFMDNGYTKEEMKMVLETKKILNDNSIKISANCVRVPVARAHSEMVNFVTKKKLSVKKAFKLLEQSKGIILKDKHEEGGYPTPLEVSEQYGVYVGRLRKDLAQKNGLAIWVVADQLYKGAALNAIEIAELFLKS